MCLGMVIQYYAVIFRASLDVKAWDVFRLLPPKSDLRDKKFWLDMSLQLLKFVTFPVVFCLLIFSAVLSKSSLLFMTSAVGWGGKNASLCGNLRSIGKQRKRFSEKD